MSSEKLPPTTEQDFFEIRNNLKAYLKNQGQFLDYDFEGSGISNLIDVLAYNTHYMALTANMTANEMFLDSSVIRNNVVSHAKALGYTPKSKRSGRTTLTLSGITQAEQNLETITTETLVLPRGSKFVSLDSGASKTFVVLKDHSMISYDGTVLFSDIEVSEGKLVSNTITVGANEKQTYEIPNKNIDTTTLKIYIKDNASSTVKVEYTLNNLLTDFNSDSSLYADLNYYFLQEGKDEKFEIYFGDGILGRKLTPGNVIEISYVITSGSLGNSVKSFGKSFSTPYIGSLVITPGGPSFGGSELETIDSIKLSAPNTFMAQNRAVTGKDYEYFVREIYPELTNISVWGGEENDPPTYGKTFIAIKPFTNAIKKIIVSRLKQYNVSSITPEVVEPYYMYLLLDVSFIYNSIITDKTENQLETSVRDTITTYNSSSLLEFNTPFRHSNFTSLIDSTDKSILSSETKVKVKQYITPLLGTSHLYEINFSNKIHNPYSGYSGENKLGAVWSNGFYRDGDTSVVFYIRDSGAGKLELYYHPAGSTEIVVFDDSFGTVDYVDRYPLLTDTNTEGKLIIPSLNITGFSGTDEFLILTAVLASSDVVPIRNQLLQIESVSVSPSKSAIL